MSYVVLFQDLTSRVVHNPTDCAKYVGMPNVACNPSLDKVANVPREYWKYHSKEVLPMTLEERMERDNLIRSFKSMPSQGEVALKKEREHHIKRRQSFIQGMILSGALIFTIEAIGWYLRGVS